MFLISHQHYKNQEISYKEIFPTSLRNTEVLEVLALDFPHDKNHLTWSGSCPFKQDL